MAKPDITVNPRGNKKKVTGPSVSDKGSAKGNRAAIRKYAKRHGGARKFSTRLARKGKR